MKFQALLLSLIILVSAFISGIDFSSSSSSKEIAVQTQTIQAENPEPSDNKQPDIGNPNAVFLKDLYSALSEKTVLIGDKLAVGLSAVSDNFNQNLAVVKEIFSANVESFLSDSSETNSNQPEPALVSSAEINKEEVLDCKKTNQPVFISKAMLMKYLDNNFNIFELNPEKRWPIASLSKLMTAVIVMEKMDLDDEITMTDKAVSSEGNGGDFKIGEIFKIRDLIKAMLMVSSNDAAVAISENFGEPRNSTELSSRGERDFINEMQKKAAELKMFQTAYLEPTGLSFINQSTVNDLAKLMTYIYFKHPEILEISRQKESEILELKSNKQRKLISINKFAGESDFIGGKTGYIDEAGRNLMALFEINGKIVLTVTLGADDSFKETERLKDFIQNCQTEKNH